MSDKGIHTNSNESDFGSLIKVIAYSFKFIKNGFFNTLLIFKQTNKKHYKLILSFIILGIILSTTYKETSRTYYTSSILISSNYFKGELMQKIGTDLNNLCEERNYSELALILQIDSITASMVKEIQIAPLVSERESFRAAIIKEQLKNLGADKGITQEIEAKFTTQSGSTFNVIVSLFNRDYFKVIEKAIMNYFINNEFSNKRIEIETKNLLAKREKIRNDSEKLDSIKSVMVNNMSKNQKVSNNTIILGETETNTLEVFREGLSIYNQELIINSELHLKASVELISGAISYSKPSNIGTIRLFALSFIVTYLLAFVLIGIIETNNYLITLEKEKDSH